MLTNFTVVIMSQYMPESNPHTVYLKLTNVTHQNHLNEAAGLGERWETF